MPMDILNTLLSGMCSASAENITFLDFHSKLFIVIGIFSPVGAPTSAQTLHRPEFAVDNYSFTQGVLCLHQPRRVNNPGKLNSGIMIVVKRSGPNHA